MSQPGGGGFRPPYRSRKPIKETSSVGYWWIARTLPSPLVPKKVQTYLVWRHSDVISDACQKMRKSLKIAKIVVFRYFFEQKLNYLAIMCVKEYLHTFLLQINQINEIKHSGRGQKRQKTRFMCNFNGKSSFSLTQRAITWRCVATLSPIFTKMVLNRAQGLKEESQEVSARKNIATRSYNKKIGGGGADSAPPGSFRVIIFHLQMR